ncbi:DNA-protecting protein DprA [Roseateles sp. DAIF2]|uniref:DNA-processing protein DprA n=1 Tax=Roseateles sp. DAIF2 TaxID=2714952 RepID=UPI0018A2D2D7|nr:DNA-processing protein DprA [Roseateles sp. DAIF2]QPF72285.1 DNA-protecting protein DprA [Roseateles sp. DAIF2]
MERSDELAAWLRLVHTPGLSNSAQRRLLAALGSPGAIFEAPAAALLSLLREPQRALLTRPPEGFEALLAATKSWLAAAPGRRLLTLADADYPAALLQTADPPTLLYLWGRAELLGRQALAMVGSRSPTPQGRDNALRLGRALGESGLTIVSGLALGIDGAAHEGALETAGGTIAVLGSGLDQLYPPAHRALAGRVAERGLLISEYPLGMPPLSANFPRRNRIIAGLASGCLVVEATLKSGSLITARLAAEAGREVFAIPGSIHAPQSRGCHALLREGAKLVETAQDVLEELQRPAAPLPAPPHAPIETAQDDPAAALLAAMGYDPVGLDALQARGGWPTGQLSALLLELELAGEIARLPGQLFQRRRGA